MYLVYVFVEKESEKVIYVGSTARPSARIKEHNLSLAGKKPKGAIHNYMIKNNLKLYKDVEVRWIDCADNILDGRLLEEKYYYLYEDTVLNERPGEDRTKNYNPRHRLVRCLEDGKEFKSVLSCSEYYNVPRTTISNQLNGYKKQVKTKDNQILHFEYINVLKV